MIGYSGLNLNDYRELDRHIAALPEGAALEVERELIKFDLFYLVNFVLSCKQWLNAKGEQAAFCQWVLDRCREVEAGGHDILRIWSRYHWKSTLETFAKTIQELLVNPEETICIFSHTRPIAKTFLGQIRRELEINTHLQRLSWSDELERQIFFDNPRAQAHPWSLDDGIVINRWTNPKNASVEAWGLVDSQPTGGRYTIMKYDDTVTLSSVSTPEMIAKTTKAWEHSQALGIPGVTRRRGIGTYYAYGDTYQEMEARGVEVEIRTAYPIVKEHRDEDGALLDIEFDFENPYYIPAEELERERQRMGEETFATQILCFPFGGDAEGFDREMIQWYDANGRIAREKYREDEELLTYILVDPAGEKKKTTYTVMWVIGARADKTLHVLDCIRDRLDLHERTEALFRLQSRWKPRQIRYEKYSMQADIEHIDYVKRERRRRFKITPVSGNLRKDDRIRRLVPIFKDERLFMPKKLIYRPVDGEPVDLVKDFMRDELTKWPKSKYKDMLDALSRIAEPDVPLIFPKTSDNDDEREHRERSVRRRRKKRRSYSWQGV